MHTLSRNNPFRPSLIAIGIITALGSAATFAAGQTTRVSIASDGTQGNSYGAFISDISLDGRFVTFSSGSTNLVPGDTNGWGDAFVHDRITKSTKRVSVSSSGEQGNHYSFPTDISADGRFIAFTSSSSNLIVSDTNGDVDAFVHDRITGKTMPVSISTAGILGNAFSNGVAISANGRYATFMSSSNNLVSDDTNEMMDVFIRDRATNTTTRVSVATDNSQGNYPSYGGSISADGRYVTFSSASDTLVPGDTNGKKDVFLRDLITKTTTRISVRSDGVQGEGGYYGADAGPISSDGRFVLFSSDFTNLVQNDINEMRDVFLYDRLTQETTRVSVSSNSAEGNGNSWGGEFSADGRYVTFSSEADNLVPGDSNSNSDVFIRDCILKKTTRVSVASGGAQGNAGSYSGGLSGDGRYMTFFSNADNLVPSDTNKASDVFVRDRLLLPNRNADIVVTQTESTDPVQKGQPLSYTVNVKNNGPDFAADVKLTDLAPSNAQLQSVVPSKGSCSKGPITICRLGSLAAGVSATVQVNLIADKSGSVKNTAYVNAPPVDGKPANNTSNISTRVQ